MQALFVNTKTRQRGFTLVELMITVAILATIAAIGTTTLLNFLPNMRLRSATRDIYSAMMLAKTEAIRRGEDVTLLCINPNAPFDAYIMFLDRQAIPPIPPAPAPATDDNDLFDAGETMLLTATTLPSRVSFDPDPAVSADGDGVSFTNNTAVFSMRGLPVGTGTVGLRATDALGNTIRQRTIAVSFAGRINNQ